MLQLTLQARDPLPLVDQIVAGVRAQIEDRLLRPGMRLPPIRRFAEAHGVSRFTVVEAYDRLVALGYLSSRRGSGFYVEQRAGTTAAPEVSGQVARAFDNAGVLHRSLEDAPNRLKVGVGWLPPSWHDQEALRRHVRALARQPELNFTCYGTAMGFAPLREQLSRRLGDFGIQAASAQILLTHGATQALDLVARWLLKPGDCVFVDDPGYWNLFANLRLYGVNLVGVPRTREGPDTDALETLLTEHRPKVFFTHSVVHNPTGSDLGPAQAFRLLQLAEKHDLLVVEDDTYCDYHPGHATRLAALDQLRRVLYVGSFSKTLSSNLRVGFLAGPADVVSQICDVKIVSCVSTPEFAERLVHEMLLAGQYRKYVERLRERLADAMTRTTRMLERNGFTLYAEPAGGMFLWARVPDGADAAALTQRAAESDIMLAPGHIFRPQLQASPWLRFNVAYATHPRLERFLREALG